MPDWLVVGLGNPGARHRATRHNVGFRILEALADRHGAAWRSDRGLDARIAHVELDGHACALIQPQTFMNRSGRCVEAALERWRGIDPEQRLLIVYDDVDLPPGRIRLRPAGSAGGHRGIGDVLEALEREDVPRLRFGVGRPGTSQEVPEWVLRPFSPEEERALPTAIARAADAIEAVAREGLRTAMGQFNAST
jgi:PTH1 family peptidyl-tRNA hydrolase